jgi:hypothetical protein
MADVPDEGNEASALGSVKGGSPIHDFDDLKARVIR